MSSSITPNADERNTLLDFYRRHPDPALRLRAHIIRLLADGVAWATITALLYCSSRTVARWQTVVHDEIYVFDDGAWSKSKSLWRSVRTASWDDVILQGPHELGQGLV